MKRKGGRRKTEEGRKREELLLNAREANMTKEYCLLNRSIKRLKSRDKRKA